MSRSITCIIMLLLVISFASQYESAGQTKKKLLEINVEDIGKSVILIGRLGKPLGTKMKIRGRWSMPESVEKDNSPRFTVTHIDGKKIDKPIEFNIGQIEARLGDAFVDPNRIVTVEEQRKGINPYNAIPNYKEWDSLAEQEWTMIAYETGSIQMPPDEYDEKEQVFPVVQLPYYTRPFTSQIVAVVTSKKTAVQK